MKLMSLSLPFRAFSAPGMPSQQKKEIAMPKQQADVCAHSILVAIIFVCFLKSPPEQGSLNYDVKYNTQADTVLPSQHLKILQNVLFFLLLLFFITAGMQLLIPRPNSPSPRSSLARSDSL